MEAKVEADRRDKKRRKEIGGEPTTWPLDWRISALRLNLRNHLINLCPHILHRLDSTAWHVDLLPVDGPSVLAKLSDNADEELELYARQSQVQAEAEIPA